MEKVRINGKDFPVLRLTSANRTASARLKGGSIVISVPSRWPRGEKERVSANLLGRAIKAIGTGRWNEGGAAKVAFKDGQKVEALGKELEIVFMPSQRFRSRLRENRVEVCVVEGHPEMEEVAARLARRRIVQDAMPRVVDEVRAVNDAHFQSHIPKVTIRDNTSRWGSCSSDGSISLNFRLLFMPKDIREYVIVHELAHTKYRSHGPRFWALVERIIPDHKDRRKWLRMNGWSVPKEAAGAGDTPSTQPGPASQSGPESAGQSALEDFSDEPY